MKFFRITIVSFIFINIIFCNNIFAHHGVAALGAVGLEGPGAPLETSTSATLPKDKSLLYLKLDHAVFKTYTDERDDEGSVNDFWMYGYGYGVTSYFSLYTFLPYYVKRTEDNSYNTADFADMSIMGVLGFKYDDGFKLIPETESLDDMTDWHFTVYGGFSIPTGNPNVKNRDGDIDGGMSTGFGKSSYSIGLTATKQINEKFTTIFETSYIGFQEYEYDNGEKGEFGGEIRFNFATVYRLSTNPIKKTRWDVSFELNYLNLGRDKTNSIGEDATGGKMWYAVPSLRYYRDNTSIAFGIKKPCWTDLNEENIQQGAEGKEDYRFIFSVSVLM